MLNNPPARPTGDQLLSRGDFVGAEAAFRTSLKTNPKDARTLLNLGVALDRLARHKDAIAYFRQASEIAETGSGNRSLALRNWASVLVTIGEPEKAENKLNEILKGNPEDVETLNILGRVLVIQGRYKDAENVFNRLIGNRSNSIKAQNALRSWGDALNDKGNFEEAAHKFEEALKIVPIDDTAKAWLHNDRGLALTGQCQFKLAIKEFEQANSLLAEGNIDRRFVLSNWANACLQDEQYEEACKHYGDAIAILPAGNDDVIGHFSYGWALAQCGRSDDALDEYERSIKADQRHPYPYNNKADLLVQLGRYNEGWKAWNQAFARYQAGRASLEDERKTSAKPAGAAWLPAALTYTPEQPGARTVSKSEAVDRAIYFANALRDVFIEYEEAEDWYELALTNAPDSLAALCGRAILFRRWSQSGQANVRVQMRAGEASRQACERLRDILDRPTRFDSQRVLADIYIEDRDWSRLRDTLDDAERECGEMRGRQTEILIRRGILALGTDKPRDAKRYFEQALIHRTGDLNLQALLGLALMTAKQHDSALTVFRRVIDLAPGHVEALIGSALASIELADDGDADYYERAERFLTDALNYGYKSESGSRRLDKDKAAVADIYYMRGYAKAKRYDADRGNFAALVVASALHDFRQALRTDPRHYLARSAITKLTQHISRRFTRTFADVVGQVVVVLAGLSVFLLAQLDFFLHDTLLRTAIGLPDKPLLAGSGSYAGVAFGALAIMIAGLSLPKLLTLKVPGVELKKAAADPVGSTLGVGRFGVLTNFVSGSLRGLNATPPRTSGRADDRG